MTQKGHTYIGENNHFNGGYGWDFDYGDHFSNIRIRNEDFVNITQNAINVNTFSSVDNFTVDNVYVNNLGVSSSAVAIRIIGDSTTPTCNGLYLNNISVNGGSGGQFYIYYVANPVLKNIKGSNSIGAESVRFRKSYNPVIDTSEFNNVYKAIWFEDCSPNVYAFDCKGLAGVRQMFDIDHDTVSVNAFIRNCYATGNSTADTSEAMVTVFNTDSELYLLDTVKTVPYEWKYVTVNAAGANSLKHIDAYGNLIDAQSTVTDNMPAQYWCMDAGTGALKRVIALSSGAEVLHSVASLGTIGAPVFVSSTGAPTLTEPASGTQRQIIGYVLNKTKIVLIPPVFQRVP
jgi:hypothetical protein